MVFWIFLTESERSGERLPRAARRVSGSKSIDRISEIFDRMTGFAEVTGLEWIVCLMPLFSILSLYSRTSSVLSVSSVVNNSFVRTTNFGWFGLWLRFGFVTIL